MRGAREQGAQFTKDDLANWRVKLEEPRHTSYRGIDVYKLDRWTQGPAMLQALNILENFDLKSMGYNSASYIHTVYQALSLAFADRDFYYGDPAFPPEEPIEGLLSKDYAKQRAALRLALRGERRRDRARRPVSVPGRQRIRTWTCWTSARGVIPAFDAARFAAATDLRHRLLLSRHDVRDRRRQGRLARLDDAERRLAACRHRRAGPASA